MIEILSRFFLHPGMFLILCYLLLHLAKGTIRKLFLFMVPIFAFIILCISDIPEITIFYISSAFLLVLLCGILFAYTGNNADKKNAHLALLYFGAAISLIMTTNLLIIFIFFEVMLVAGTLMIFNGNNKLSSSAGIAYFKFHLLAGTLFLIGVITHYTEYGNFNMMFHNFSDFTAGRKQLITLAILCSLLINVATPPCAYWLVEGYAATTPGGSVFLSVVNTKVAVFLIAQLFLGQYYLMYVGIFMSVYGVIYASLEGNMRRVINFSIISQLGIILISISLGGHAGFDAAIFMIISEIIYVAFAMMCVSTITLLFHSKRYFQIGNDASKLKFIMLCSIVAFSSISSIPFTPGYVGKYLLYNHEYVLENQWLKYVISGLTAAITFAVGMKLMVFIFIQKFHQQDISRNLSGTSDLRKIALAILLCATLLLGIFPQIVSYKKIVFFDSLFWNQVFMISGVAISFLLLGKFLIVKQKHTLLDFDWIYRFMLMKAYLMIKNLVIFTKNKVIDKKDFLYQKSILCIESYFNIDGHIVSIKSQKNIILVIICILIVLIIKI